MIIEHVFVTTLDGPDAIRLAWEYLEAGGFARRDGIMVKPADPGTKLDMGRGKANAARAKSLDELPQRVWIEWDRGRVTVAASIEYFQTGSFTAGSRTEPPAHSPKLKQHIDLMHALIGGLEAVLTRGLPINEARRTWADLEARLRDEALRTRRKRSITLIVVFVAIVLLIVLAIVLNA